MDFVQKSDSGIALAWFLATLGPRRTRRKLLNRSLTSVCIPATCNTISSFATDTMHLRLSSNLMYGLSLIYKQQVDHMLSDIASVHSRLSAPHFSGGWTESTTRCVKSSTGPVYLKDDLNFNMDFHTDLPLDFIAQNCSLKNLDRILKIRQSDHERNSVTDAPPLVITANERDRLFSEFMELTTLNLQPDLTAEDHVSFAFDEDGQIVGDNNSSDPDQNLLDGIDFDEDYISTAPHLDEISKSVSGTNDPHFSTTLDATRMVLTLEPSRRKRRRIRLDDPTRLFGTVVSPINMSLYREKRCQSLAETTALISRSNPPFLNYCLRMVFGREHTSMISNIHLPLRSRQLQYSEKLSLLHNEEDIELGRNVAVSRRQSSSHGLRVGRNEEYENQNMFAFGAFDLNLDWEPAAGEPFISEDSDESAVAQSLSQFYDYITEIVDSDHTGVTTFDKLVPSCKPGEPSTNKRIAASAFASILELSTKSRISLHSKENGVWYQSSHPLHIGILLLD